MIPIPATHAYGIRTLRDVKAGEHLTVNRSRNPYSGYQVEAQCRCMTCGPPPPISTETTMSTPDIASSVSPAAVVAGVEVGMLPEIQKVPAMPRSASEERELRSKRKCEARKRRFDQELAQLKKEDRQWQERERKRLRQAEREQTRDGI